MDIKPTYTTIGKVFEQNFLFEVPKYQRYYAWEEEQVDDYIYDFDKMLSAKEQGNVLEHFFGGVVCVEKSVPGSNRQQRELIDGQQRITTTILLIIGVYRQYEEIKNYVSEGDQKELVVSRLDKIKEKYIIYKDEIDRRPEMINRLILSEADDDYFRGIIKNQMINPTRDSHKKMSKAYKKLCKYIEVRLKDCGTIDQKMDVLADIEDIVNNNCCIIFIDTKTKNDAYILFQVLNDRGTGLTVGDLLKSRTLEILEHYPDVQKDLLNKWNEILQSEDKKIERFLRYYYMSMVGKRAGSSSLYDDFMKNIFAIDETKSGCTEDEMESVSKKMANTYTENITFKQIAIGEWPYEEQQPITAWNRSRLRNLVKYLEYEITLALLLAASNLEQKQFSDIVLILERFMFRFKGICNNNHQKLSELFMKEAIFIRGNLQDYHISHLTQQLSTLLESEASETKFRANLQDLKYVKKGNNKILKYLFATLDEYNSWYAEGAKGQPKCDTGRIIDFENISIEHIASQHPEEEGITVVNNIKNLTLLTLQENGERAANKNFEEKKSVYINSTFTINKKISEYDVWDVDSMDEWQAYILDMCCKVFVI